MLFQFFFLLNYKGIDEAVVFFEMVFGVDTSLQQKVKDAQLPFFSVGTGTPSDLGEIESRSQLQQRSLCIASLAEDLLFGLDCGYGVILA